MTIALTAILATVFALWLVAIAQPFIDEIRELHRRRRLRAK